MKDLTFASKIGTQKRKFCRPFKRDFFLAFHQNWEFKKKKKNLLLRSIIEKNSFDQFLFIRLDSVVRWLIDPCHKAKNFRLGTSFFFLIRGVEPRSADWQPAVLPPRCYLCRSNWKFMLEWSNRRLSGFFVFTISSGKWGIRTWVFVLVLPQYRHYHVAHTIKLYFKPQCLLVYLELIGFKPTSADNKRARTCLLCQYHRNGKNNIIEFWHLT